MPILFVKFQAKSVLCNTTLYWLCQSSAFRVSLLGPPGSQCIFKRRRPKSSAKESPREDQRFCPENSQTPGLMTALPRPLLPGRTCHMFFSGCRSVLIRFTIQLKSLPYKALDMASRTSEALSTVLARMMVSPRVTTQCDVRASWSSSGRMQRTEAAGTKRQGDTGE